MTYGEVHVGEEGWGSNIFFWRNTAIVVNGDMTRARWRRWNKATRELDVTENGLSPEFDHHISDLTVSTPSFSLCVSSVMGLVHCVNRSGQQRFREPQQRGGELRQRLFEQ